MEQKLIVFLKYPDKGRVKTRLARSIGDEEAACVYKKLAEDTVNTARLLQGKAADVVIAYDPPGREEEFKKWLPGRFGFVPQGSGSLGQRLARQACLAFQEGVEKVVMVGSDCSDLDAFTINRAFWALSKKDTVIGPSKDGGYYLIGLKRAEHTALFDNMPWSTPEVFKSTFRKVIRDGLSCELLPEKMDVDTVDDLRHHYSVSKSDVSCEQNRISVIIPTFNEARNIEAVLMGLMKDHHPYEVIVADGGSVDGTAETAAKYARVVRSEKGRAVQMNAGAVQATGEIFLFLHADTTLPKDALTKIKQTLELKRNNSGRFRMRFGHPHPLLKFYEVHTRFHMFSYGDQAFFVRRALFQKMGGFHVDALFEDIDFYRRLLKHERPAIIKDPVTTSPRRFLQNGIIRQKLINISLATMYYLGFQHSTIKHFCNAWYKDIREHAELKSV